MLLLHGNNRYHAKEHEYQGTDIAAENTYRAELGLKVYGKSTQNGVPSPENPIPINSIGDSGSVDVVVSDNNGNSQTLTVNTPNGLCGIPVDTGGNYTDSTGQQWVCDEVDFERGVYVQRIKALKCTTFSKQVINSQVTLGYLRAYAYDSAAEGTGINAYKYVKCDKMPSVSQLQETAYDYPVVTPYGHKDSLELRFRAPKTLYDSIDNFQAAVTGCIVIYPLATPIETPLTEEELAAYKAIKSYPYYTHIESVAELGVKLKEY